MSQSNDIDLTTYSAIPAIYMSPETGSVDTESGWKESCTDNGENFDPSDFVEVCSVSMPALRGVSLEDNDPEGWMELRRVADLMDPELRERVHDEWQLLRGRGYAMSDQAFLTRYCDLHRERFGEDFAPVED